MTLAHHLRQIVSAVQEGLKERKAGQSCGDFLGAIATLIVAGFSLFSALGAKLSKIIQQDRVGASVF